VSVPVPFPSAEALLLLALPGVWLLARALAYAVTRDLGLRAVLPVGLCLCLWLAAVHAASLAAGSLTAGLPIATLSLAAAGVLAERRRRRRPEPGPVEGRRPPAIVWISMAVTAALLAPAAFRFWFHDELSFTGHMSTAAAMQNGIYPPRHLSLPDVPLRYHYGFDLFTACLTALFRLQVDRAIDVATLVLWCASWCLFSCLGERLSGRAGAWLTPPLALLAGGAPIACDRPGPSAWYSVTVECGAGDRSVNAPVASYFFQHPWALGIPVAATAALLLTERRPPSAGARLFALGLALALLSLSEIALFAAVLPAIVVAEARYEGRFELRRGAALAGVAALVLGVARLAGGFFARVPAGEPLRLILHAGFADGAASTLAWNVKTFGVLLPLGAAGLALMKRGRVLWGLLAAGSIAVVNGVRFTGTEDIMKFATVASIALGVLASAALARLLARPSALRVAGAAALGASATAASVAFLLAFALDLPAIPAVLRRRPEALSSDEIEAMTFVRGRARAGELVYHARRGADGWAQWGGVPQPQRSWTDRAFGLPGPRLTARDMMLERMPAEAGAYRAHGFVWFVLDGGEAPLARASEGWIREGTAREAARFGALRVVELSR
jgi:hypothetical protein